MTAEHQLHDSAGAAGQAVKDGDQRSESSPADPILRWRRSAFGVPFEVTFIPGAFRAGSLDDPPRQRTPSARAPPAPDPDGRSAADQLHHRRSRPGQGGLFELSG